MKTNTPYFRAALTITAVWSAVFAYLAYSEYRGAYRSTEDARYAFLDEDTDRCSSPVLDTTNPASEFRRPTSEERSSCLQERALQHSLLSESSNRFALEQAWKSFGWKGVLPALLLCATVVFWTDISNGVSRVGSGYLGWLRFGSTKPKSDDKSDES